MLRRILLSVGLLELLAVIAFAAAVYFLAYTATGLQFIVRQVPERIGRAQLSFGGVSGTLTGGLRLERFEVEHERVHLIFEDISGRISLAPLFLRTVRAPELAVGRAFVEVRRRQQPPATYEPRFLPRGLHIRVDRVRIAAGTLVVPNGQRFEATELTASGTAAHKLIRLHDASFLLDLLAVEGDGTLRAADPMQLDLNIRMAWEPRDQPAWTISGSAQGDLDELALSARLTSPFRADFEGRAADLARGWHWDGNARIHDLDLRAWGAGDLLGRISGQLALEGDASGFRARGPVVPEGLRAGEFDLTFEGAYAARTLTARRIELVHQASGAWASGEGEIGIVQGGPRLALEGDWRKFRWPLVGDEAAVRSANGRYVLRGTWPFALQASGELAVPRLEPFPVEIEGALNRDRLSISRGTIGPLGGSVQISGELVWGGTPDRWALQGRATGIDPARFRPDLPGNLTFAFEAQGSELGADADFAMKIRDLSGKLRGVAARGGGALARTGGVWQFDDVRLNLGGADLSLDGKLDGDADLRFAVRADDLSLLDADSSGRLRARGRIRGNLHEPVIEAEASGSAIRHAGLGVGNFDAAIDFDARVQRPSRIDIRARRVTFLDRTIDRLKVDLDGAAADHVLKVDLDAEGLSVRSQANGAFSAGTWQGRLLSLDVNGSETLALRLEEPVALLASRTEARVDPFCLQGKPGRLCADGSWNPQTWSARLNATDLPLGTLTAGMTRDVEYRGVVDVTANAFGDGSSPLQGSLRAQLTDAELAHRRPNGRIQLIRLGSGQVTAQADASTVTADVSLDAQTVGTIKGRLTAERSSSDWRTFPLRGDLRVETGELGLVSLYVPQVDRTAGHLTADLVVSGMLGRPLVNGIIRLSNAELDFYQVNLVMRGVGLEARLLDNGLDFIGSARIGEGTVSAGGLITWRDGLPYGRLNIEGQSLRVVNLPEAEIDASPDLDFVINGRRIEVTGRVRVPYARIAPVELTGAVRTSADEIVEGEETEDPAQRFKVETNITLSLGEKVSIDTYGLTGRLTGDLVVRSGYDEVTRGAGELDVVEGRYTAYGRRLEIERGRLIFTGGPINNPGVDIRAVKRFPDIVAGVNVRGTLLQPRMTLFSEPSRSQSEIVSMILAGGSLASLQDGNGRNGSSNPDAARNELLAQGGAILAQQIGERIGLEDVSIESNPDNETSLVLGKYLSPRFYVSYGISLTESLNTLKLRYSLGDRWTIRTEVGEERSADLVYTIEK